MDCYKNCEKYLYSVYSRWGGGGGGYFNETPFDNKTIVFMQKYEKHCLFLLRKKSFIFSLPQNPDIRHDYENFIRVYPM